MSVAVKDSKIHNSLQHLQAKGGIIVGGGFSAAGSFRAVRYAAWFRGLCHAVVLHRAPRLTLRTPGVGFTEPCQKTSK